MDCRRPLRCLKALSSLSLAAGPHEKRVTFTWFPDSVFALTEKLRAGRVSFSKNNQELEVLNHTMRLKCSLSLSQTPTFFASQTAKSRRDLLLPELVFGVRLLK